MAEPLLQAARVERTCINAKDDAFMVMPPAIMQLSTNKDSSSTFYCDCTNLVRFDCNNTIVDATILCFA